MKLLINDTISVHPQHAENWLNWIQAIVLPVVKKESVIESFRVTRIRGNDDEHGITYALQFICPDETAYSDFIENFDPRLQQEQQNRFSGNFGAFRSVLEIIEEG
jgi:hypothetical protein